MCKYREYMDDILKNELCSLFELITDEQREFFFKRMYPNINKDFSNLPSDKMENVFRLVLATISKNLDNVDNVDNDAVRTR